ncbi:MAG: hypothetical protein E7365_04795 [Clostridiales bacterium]|nr:hypothetical protein [Clostridiales bacterium]
MDRTNEFNKRDIEENKGISCFAYFGFMFIMPLWAASDSPYAQFHAKQGKILAINELLMCVLIFLAHILVPLMPSLFRMLRTLLCLMLFLSMLFYVIYGVTNTMRGKAKELPLIGTIKSIR